MSFEAEDFLGIVYLVPGTNRAVAYLVPSKVAAPAFIDSQQCWFDANPDHDQDNRLFVLRFDKYERGSRYPGFAEKNGDFATKWAQYCLGEIDVPAAPAGDAPVEAPAPKGSVAAVIERHRQEIAEELRVIPEAVSITVNLVYEDPKTGKLRDTFEHA